MAYLILAIVIAWLIANLVIDALYIRSLRRSLDVALEGWKDSIDSWGETPKEEKEKVMKYRKKPVVVEAIRYTGNNCPEIAAFMGVQGGCDGKHDPRGYGIDTPDGQMEADPGDWIIKDAWGKYYPCKPDIFEATYERVKNPETCESCQ